MRMRKYCLLAMLWPVMTCFCQSPPDPIRPLNIGDTIPVDLELTNVYNYPVSKIRLSDLKGKLVILDFWSSSCGSCINLFPHLDSLQERFKNELQIILANTKSEETKDDLPKIKRTINGVIQRSGRKIQMPVAYNSKKLDEFFPCIIIPHEVWIDKNGIVVGITSPEEVNYYNIKALLDGQKVAMRVKQDLFDYDFRKPLFIDGNAGNGNETLYRSLITANIDGLASRAGVRRKGDEIVGFYAINQTLLSLVRMAYGREIRCTRNLIFTSNKEAFEKKYSYELIIPPTDIDAARNFFKNDLKRYFNVSVKKERRQVQCLVLKVSSPPHLTKRCEHAGIDIESATLHKYIRNYSPSFVADLLNDYSSIPIVDETKISSRICIDLPFDLGDIRQLQSAFKEIGFELSKENRELDVVVISDK